VEKFLPGGPIVDRLNEIISDLENPVESTRIRAVVNLVRSGQPKVIPHLERSAEHDESPQIRYLARKGLKLLKDRALNSEQRKTEVEHFGRDAGHTVTDLVKSHDTEERRRGFQLAAYLKDASLYPLLENAYIREEVPIVKPSMLSVLTILDKEKAIPHIREALKSPEHRLRAAAVETAGMVMSDELVDCIIPRLNDRDNRVAANAALALKEHGSAAVLKSLERMLDSPDVGRRDSAVFALAEMKCEAALPLLARACLDDMKTVRGKAVEGLKTLAERGAQQAGELLEKVRREDKEGLADFFTLAAGESVTVDLYHEDFSVRLQAVKDLVKSANHSMLQDLKEALQQEHDTFVASAMVRALGELGSSDDITAVTPHLESRDPRIRANAVEAAARLAPAGDTLKLLLPTLKDGNNRVRANAVVALAKIFPREAIEALRTMVEEPDIRMKLSAAYACLETASDEAVELLKTMASERDLRIAEKALTSLSLLKDRGHPAATEALKQLEKRDENLADTDSFVAFEDGSVIHLTPGPDTESTGDDEQLPGQMSVISPLKSEYGLESNVDLHQPEESVFHSSSTRDKYVISGEVGRGGMGVILNAVDTDIRREVAMKVITGRRGESRDYLERFVGEAQVQGQLEHPNICPVHELGVDRDGRVYFTMKIVKGSSLAEMIKQARESGGTADSRRLTNALNIFLKICDGMAFAHSRGVIHRDLKPDNIMVGDFGEVYVMDWGLAKIIGREDDRMDGLVITDRSEEDGEMKTMTGSVVGTPSYMPPEQSKGIVEEMDERSDIYSLGGLLYELLSLERPFTGKTPWEILEKVTGEPPVPPSTQAPEQNISPELDTVVLKCLEKDKEDRYGSIQELKHDVELFLSGRPIEAMEYSPWQVFAKWMSRNRVLTAAIAAVVSVIVVSCIVGYINNVEKKNIAEEALVKVKRESDRTKDALAQVEEQKLIAEANEKKAKIAQADAEQQKSIAEDERHKAEERLVKSLVSAGRLAEDNRNIREAMEHYKEAKAIMRSLKKPIHPYIDLDIWRAVNCGGGFQTTIARIPFKTDVRAVTFSPDGRSLIIGCDGQGDPTNPNHPESTELIFLYNLDSGKLSPLSDTDGFGVLCLSTHPKDNKLAFGKRLGAVKIWDLAQPPRLSFLGIHRKDANFVAFSPDGKLLASGGEEKTVHLWDLQQQTNLKTIADFKRSVLSGVFSSDGNYLVTGTRNYVVKVFDVATGELKTTLWGHSDHVDTVAASPSGKIIASGSRDNTIKIWDFERIKTDWKRTEPVTLRGHGENVESIDFSPDGQVLASGSADGTVKLWQVGRKEEATTSILHTVKKTALTTIRDHSGIVYGVAFSPDGMLLASGGKDDNVIVRHVGDIITIPFTFETGTMKGGTSQPATATGSFSLKVDSLAFSADGKRIFAGPDGDGAAPIRSWDTTGRPVHTFPGHWRTVLSLAVSPDGTLLASGSRDGALKLWDIENNSYITTFDRGGFFALLTDQDYDIHTLGFSPDGTLLAAGTKDCSVDIWNVSSRTLVRSLKIFNDDIKTLVFSPDGTRLATGEKNGAISLWDASSSQLLKTTWGHEGNVYDLAFSPDGKLLISAGQDNFLKLWDAHTLAPFGQLEGHRGDVTSVCFRPDGKLMVSGSVDDTVKIWDTATFKCLETFSEHNGDVTDVLFSPDGKLLATGSADRTIKLWRFGDIFKPLSFAPRDTHEKQP